MLGQYLYYARCLDLAKRFREYDPKPVRYWDVVAYLRQFDRKDRSHAIKMLQCVQFIGREALLSLMLAKLQEIVKQAETDEISPDSVIVVPASAAGDSSAQVHALLSNDQRCTALGVIFFSGTPLQLASKIKPLQSPVIVFVDDFAGSGEQFVKAHKGWSGAIQRYSPTTYFLACIMCSPAIDRTSQEGVIATPGREHRTSEMFSECTQAQCGFEGACILRSYAEEIHSALPLGFKNMGSMVVLFRNSSNNMPFLIRGTLGQRVWKGLFPRRDQLKPSLKALA